MNIRWILKLLIAPLLGIVLMTVPMVYTVKAITSPDLVTAQAPGNTDFTVTEEDSYTVWRVSAGVLNDTQFRIEGDKVPAGLSFQIYRHNPTHRQTGESGLVKLEEAMGTRQTSDNSPTKVSLAKAHLTPGKYTLAARSDNEPLVLTISKSVGSFRGFLLGFACVAVGFLVLAAGVVFAVVQILRCFTGSTEPTGGPTGAGTQ